MILVLFGDTAPMAHVASELLKRPLNTEPAIKWHPCAVDALTVLFASQYLNPKSGEPTDYTLLVFDKRITDVALVVREAVERVTQRLNAAASRWNLKAPSFDAPAT